MLDVEKFVYESMGSLVLSRTGVVDLVRAALARDRGERGDLSADLERLMKKIPNGRIEWSPGTGVVVLRPGKTGARYFWSGLDYCGTGVGFTNFGAAVAAALKELKAQEQAHGK